MNDDQKRLTAIEESLQSTNAKLDLASKEVNKATNKLDLERVDAVLGKRAIEPATVTAYNTATATARELYDLIDALELEKTRLREMVERSRESDRYQRLLVIRRRVEAPRAKLMKAMTALSSAAAECMSLLNESHQVWADINADPGSILFPSESVPNDPYRGFQERSLRALILGRALELGRIAKQ